MRNLEEVNGLSSFDKGNDNIVGGTHTSLDSSFLDVGALSSGGNVFIVVNDGTVRIETSAFSSDAVNRKGGGLAILRVSSIQFLNSSFNGNVAIDGEGGGIDVSESGTISIYEGLLESNTADLGAALYSEQPLTVTVLSIVNSQLNDIFSQLLGPLAYFAGNMKIAA